jgi:hypothetical protein
MIRRNLFNYHPIEKYEPNSLFYFIVIFSLYANTNETIIVKDTMDMED